MLPLYLLSLPRPAAAAPGKAASPSPLAPAPARKFSAPDYSQVKKFYLTTAINYTNGSPHFGHAYEAILSDMIVRYHRACGREVFFLTGTDEHGQKVQKSAEAAGRTPQAHCDLYADQFKALDEQLLIHYDRFVRTTSPEHKQTAQRFWDLVKERGDLYLSSYEGWYNRNEEEYVSSSEVLKLGKHPVTGVPVDAFGRELERRASEECFFFKMSKYADKLREHIALNPNFIQPASCRAEIVSFLSNNVLDDLCVSRTSITWGVPIPDESHANHVMYVWFDALTNYLTGVDALTEGGGGEKGFWPCSVHVVGKDIVRFHTVYWPTMLMAAGLPLPQTVFGHGFVTDKMGVKMSKSLGNVSDPLDAAKLYGVDALRYYLARSSAFGWDLPYNEELLVNMNNDILLKGFGNLVQRCYKVTLDCSGSQLPSIAQPTVNGKQHAFDLNELKSEFEACFAVLPTASSSSQESEADDTQKCGLRVRDAMCALERAVGQTNTFVAECEPWKKKGDEHLAYRQECALVFMQAIYALAHFYRFFCPILADRVVREILLTEFAPSLGALDFTGLQPGHPIRSGEEELVLVDGLEVGKGKKLRLTSGADKVKQREEERSKKVAQDAENKKNKEQAKFAQANSSVFDSMDIRVGVIVSAELVPGTKLFRERVQVGAEVIDVCSGLGGNYSAEQLVNRRVLVVLNLEPFTPKQLEGSGFVSTGLLLTGKEGDVIELLTPPVAARVGERLASSLLKELSEVVPKANDKQWSKVKHSFKVVDGKVSIGANSVLLGWECKQPCEPLALVKTGAVV